jgi:ATP-dependent Clp protease ATP-binding subunit ClpA
VFERFTERARQVVVLAQDEARVLRHNYIGTEHLLLGLLREDEGLGARVLDSFDVTLEEVRAQVARIIGEGDEILTGQIPFTPRAKRVLELALREALQLGHNHIGTAHILLGLVHEGGGVAMRILLDFDVDAEKARNEVVRVLSGGPASVEPVAPLAADLQEEISRVRAERAAALETQEFEKAASLRTRERNLLRLGRSGDVASFWEEARRPLPAADLRLPRRGSRPLPRPPASRDGPGPVGLTLPFLAGGATFGVALGLGILLGRLIWG